MVVVGGGGIPICLGRVSINVAVNIAVNIDLDIPNVRLWYQKVFYRPVNLDGGEQLTYKLVNLPRVCVVWALPVGVEMVEVPTLELDIAAIFEINAGQFWQLKIKKGWGTENQVGS